MTPIANLLSSFLSLINTYIIPLLVALAIVSLFWGIVKYIYGGAEGHKEGMNIIAAGVIGLVVMLSIWGIVNLVGQSFGITGQTTVTLPHVN